MKLSRMIEHLKKMEKNVGTLETSAFLEEFYVTGDKCHVELFENALPQDYPAILRSLIAKFQRENEQTQQKMEDLYNMHYQVSEVRNLLLELAGNMAISNGDRSFNAYAHLQNMRNQAAKLIDIVKAEMNEIEEEWR